MNHSGLANARSTERTNNHLEDERLDSLLGVLEDDDSRAMIEATTARPLAASELSETCDLPLSTTYRKLDQLTEAGLLEEQVRLSASGQHKSEYSPVFDRITLEIGAEGISLELSESGASDTGHSAVAGAD